MIDMSMEVALDRRERETLLRLSKACRHDRATSWLKSLSKDDVGRYCANMDDMRVCLVEIVLDFDVASANRSDSVHSHDLDVFCRLMSSCFQVDISPDDVLHGRAKETISASIRREGGDTGEIASIPLEPGAAMTPEQFGVTHAGDTLEQLLLLKGDLLCNVVTWAKLPPIIEDEDLWPQGGIQPFELNELLRAYLGKTDQLIAKRIELEGRTADDIEYPEGFIAACDTVYNQTGPIHKATEMLGCWVFSSPMPTWNSGPVGVVISTGEAVHFHIPSLIDSETVDVSDIEKAVGVKADVILDALFSNDDFPSWPTPLRYWKPAPTYVDEEKELPGLFSALTSTAKSALETVSAKMRSSNRR